MNLDDTLYEGAAAAANLLVQIFEKGAEEIEDPRAKALIVEAGKALSDITGKYIKAMRELDACAALTDLARLLVERAQAERDDWKERAQGTLRAPDTLLRTLVNACGFLYGAEEKMKGAAVLQAARLLYGEAEVSQVQSIVDALFKDEGANGEQAEKGEVSAPGL